MFLMERVVNTNFCVQTKFCNYDGLKFRSAKTSCHGIISFRSKIYANIRINTNCVRVKFCHYDDLQFRSAKTSWCGFISIFLKTVYVSKCMMDRVIHISNEILSLWLPKIPKRKDQLLWDQLISPENIFFQLMEKSYSHVWCTNANFGVQVKCCHYDGSNFRKDQLAWVYLWF